VAGAGVGVAGAGAGVGDGVGVVDGGAAGGVSGAIDGTCCGPGTTTRCGALCFGAAAGLAPELRAWPLNAWAATTDSVVASPALPAATAQVSLRTLRIARSRREGLT
jgi:hypothetical protein